MTDTYLVTGAMGCIGAWTLYHLVKQGKRAVSFDVANDRSRLDLLLSRAEQEAITFILGDLIEFDQVRAVLRDQQVTHVIHLAALQVPTCRAKPTLGSQVNVTGTVNVFEGARQAGIAHVAHASSIAVYGSPEDYSAPILPPDAPVLPRTLYGIFKVADEGIARVYWQDYQLSSTALRPYTVYGVGRDQGLTSEPTKAMLAAAHGENYHIGFGGRMQFHLASDVAQQFIEATEKPLAGAFSFNLGSAPVGVSEVARLIMDIRPGVTITSADTVLPFPEGCDGSALRASFEHVYETPLIEGLRDTIRRFGALRL